MIRVACPCGQCECEPEGECRRGERTPLKAKGYCSHVVFPCVPCVRCSSAQALTWYKARRLTGSPEELKGFLRNSTRLGASPNKDDSDSSIPEHVEIFVPEQ